MLNWILIKMKVLILNPPAKNLRFTRNEGCQADENTWLDIFPPVLLAGIAGAIREKYKIKVIDCMGARISYDECIKQTKEFNPDFTVIDTSTPTIVNDMEVAKAIKNLTGSKIILYGDHVTACYKKIFEEYPYIDYTVIGEPETPIINILAGNPKVKGVATKNFDGGVWQEPDLDKLPFPAYDLLPIYRYPFTGERWMFIRNGRGCNFNCSYCVLAGKNARYHSNDYMIKQLKWLVNDLDIKLYMFRSEIATFDKKRMLDLCDRITGEGLHKKFKWFCTTRVDRFDEELAKNMYKAGCRMITFGLESGSQEVLNRVRKGTKIEQIIKAIKAAKKYKIKTIGHFIVGLPGSSHKSERQSIKLAKKLKLNFAQFFIASPFPGTEFYKEAIQNKWFEDENWDHVHVRDIAISYPDFPADEIKKWKGKAYRSFYFRPYAVYSLLTSISLRKFFELPRYIIDFFGWRKSKD